MRNTFNLSAAEDHPDRLEVSSPPQLRSESSLAPATESVQFSLAAYRRAGTATAAARHERAQTSSSPTSKGR